MCFQALRHVALCVPHLSTMLTYSLEDHRHEGVALHPPVSPGGGGGGGGQHAQSSVAQPTRQLPGSATVHPMHPMQTH